MSGAGYLSRVGKSRACPTFRLTVPVRRLHAECCTSHRVGVDRPRACLRAGVTAGCGRARAEVSAKTWLANREQIEAYLKTAEVVALEDLQTGVTKPRRAKLAPGGPVEAFAWKVVPPGRPSGYLGELQVRDCRLRDGQAAGPRYGAAHRGAPVNNTTGAAVMWCSPTKSFGQLKGVPTAPPQHHAAWNRQLVTRQDVRQPHWQQRPQSRELAGRSGMEPDPDRPHARVHDRQGPGPQEDEPHRRRSVGQDERADARDASSRCSARGWARAKSRRCSSGAT